MTYPLENPPLYTIDACPGNQTEWEAASRRLNCTMKSNVFKNRYHCVATRDRSRLVEFCYPQYRSLFGKGQCVIIDPPLTLDNYTCLHFTNGCPDDNYFTDQLYKYPNCFRIEPALKCFISDESCLKKNRRITAMQSEEESTSQLSIAQNFTKQSHKKKDLVPILVPTFLLLGIFFGIVIFTMTRLKRRNCLTTKNPMGDVHSVKSDVTEYLLQSETENVNKIDSIEIYRVQDETNTEDKNVIVERRDWQRDEEHIDKDLQQKIGKTRKILKDFKENISDVFVKTRAHKTVLSKIKKQRYCIVKGNPGDGKTTTAKHILLELEQEGMYPIEIYTIKDIETLPMCSKIAIFIDNIFGENGLLEDELHDFKVRETMIKATVSNDEGNGNILITTIRNDVYKECANILRHNDFLNSSVIDISDTENQIKGEEFQEFVKKYRLQHLNPYMEKIDIQHFGCSVGIPQCFRLLQNKIDSNTNDVRELFVNPLNYLQSEIEKRMQKKEPKTAVLIYILLCGGNISKDTLWNVHKDMARKYKAMSIIRMKEDGDSLQKFHSSIGSFDGIYMIYDDIEQTYRFSHSSVQQSLFHYLWQYHPKEIISECDPSLFVPLTASNTTQNAEAIEVEMFPLLVERIKVLITEIKTMSAFKSISLMKLWSNNEFIENFMKNKKCVKAMIECVDEREDSMLVHFSKVGNAKIVGFLLHYSSEKEIYKSLNKACNYNYIDVVDLILEKTNVIYDLRTCFYAVQSGNIDMLFRFTDNVDLKQTEFSNHPGWSFLRGGLLHEICFFGQNQLIEPVLRRCSIVRDVKNEQGGNALHFVAFAGQKDSFKMLINSGSDLYARSHHGSTVLHYACQNGKLDMVKYICETYPNLLKKTFDDYEGHTSLHWAAQSGNIELYEYLLEKGVIVSITKGQDSPLKFACRSGQIQMCNYLVLNHPKLLNISDKNGLTVLHDAAWGGNIDVFKFLLDKGLDVKSRTIKGKTVLHHCCMNGKLEMCKYLVNKHSELIEISDNDGRTVLHGAAWGGNVDVFQFLIEKGLDFKSTTNKGKTVLHQSCMNGKLEMCKYLVNKHSELIEISDNDGRTVLHGAAWGGNVDVFQFLIEKGLDFKSTTNKGKTVLHLSCMNGELEMCKYLVNKHSELIEISDNDGRTVLHDAAWGGNVDVFRLLIEKGLDFKSTTNEGKTVLHQSCMNGKLEMCKYLVNKHSELIEISDNDAETALHDAAWGGNVDVFQFLIEKGLDFKSTTNEGKTVLHLSCMNGELEMCKYLVNKHSELIEISDNDGRTVLHDAAWGGNVDAFQFLIEKGLDFQSTTNKGKTVLHQSCMNGKLEMCKYLVNKHSELIEISDDDEETALHDAALGGNVDVFKLLIEKGLDFKSTTNKGKTVLHQSCMNGKLEMCKYLVNKHSELIEISDDVGRTVLHGAAWGGNVNVFKLLIEKGLDFKSTTNKGKTVLHQSCMNGKLEMCKYLVNKHSELIEISDDDEETALHDAAWGGNVDVFKLLIEKGLDFKSTTNKGKTVLHLSCMNGKLAMSMFLLSHCPHFLNMKNIDNENALPDAAWGGDVDLFKFLIEKGLDINSSSRYGKSMLHWSCRNGKLEMSKYLVSKYPDLLRAIDYDGMNVLHDAAFGGSVELFEFLIGKGLDVDSRANNGKTVLAWCCRKGKQAMFKYLNKKYPHFLHLKDDDDENVIHDAAFGGNVDLFKFLMEEGFDVKSKTKGSKTLLHQSCKNGELAMCEYLFQIHPELVKCIDSDGGNLLHDSAWGGNVEVFKFVLGKGLDVNSKTKKGKTVLHQCCMNGEVHMCKYLTSHYPDLLEHMDSDGESVLHDAAFGGNIYLLDFLIDKGLDVNRKTNKGKTVLHKCCMNGKVQMCEYLVNHQPQLLTVQDIDGVNALHDAAYGGNTELFKFLLEKGLDVHSKTGNGHTVLHRCCHEGKQAMFDYLTVIFSDLLYVVDNEGNTVLHVACLQNQTKMCSSLVHNFPNLLDIENKYGEKVVVCLVDGKQWFKMTNEQ
ncbi:uncharacterized protein LOC133198422 [Saccostrea echinata]|uniref:uncharacterized protein LOC133198422 n=1 Tax=Saccostrea echinata TaxID=191078 RepID=UPI002A80D653|nr:uncharacterized protein LOC133198422 [Saccostrea echinata]